MVPRASDMHLDPKTKPPPQTSIHDLSISSFITLRFESTSPRPSLYRLSVRPVAPTPLLEKKEFEIESEAVQEEIGSDSGPSGGGFAGAL